MHEGAGPAVKIWKFLNDDCERTRQSIEGRTQRSPRILKIKRHRRVAAALESLTWAFRHAFVEITKNKDQTSATKALRWISPRMWHLDRSD